MNPKILIRIAALTVLLLLIGQSMGMLMWDNPADAQKKTVVQLMKAVSTPFMGATKSLADFYTGNNWLIFGFHGLVIFILWVLSAQIGSPQKRLVVTIVSAIALIYLIFSVVYFIYFFPLPIILSLLTSIFLGLGIISRPSSPAPIMAPRQSSPGQKYLYPSACRLPRHDRSPLVSGDHYDRNYIWSHSSHRR